MSMRLIKRSAQALSAAAIFCSMPAFAGTITPTGGSPTDFDFGLTVNP